MICEILSDQKPIDMLYPNSVKSQLGATFSLVFCKYGSDTDDSLSYGHWSTQKEFGETEGKCEREMGEGKIHRKSDWWRMEFCHYW